MNSLSFWDVNPERRSCLCQKGHFAAIFELFDNVIINWATQNKNNFIMTHVHEATGSACQISEKLEQNWPFKASLKCPSRFQSCNNVVNTTFIVHCELNVLSNVEAMLEKRCNSDVVISTSLQHSVLVARHCDLIDVVTTLWACWDI